MLPCKNKNGYLAINQLRKSGRVMGYGQKRIAKYFGNSSPAMVSRWENGNSLPSLRNALKLSILYRQPIDHLFSSLSLEVRRELYNNGANIFLPKTRKRILGVCLGTRNIGIVILEDNVLLDWQEKYFRGRWSAD